MHREKYMSEFSKHKDIKAAESGHMETGDAVSWTSFVIRHSFMCVIPQQKIKQQKSFTCDWYLSENTVRIQFKVLTTLPFLAELCNSFAL